MQNFFSRRTSWNLTANHYTEVLEEHRRAGRELLDLTASNPTTIGLEYDVQNLLQALAAPEALRYDPQAKGLLSAREAVAAYYAERGAIVAPDNLILTTSTSEAYSYIFRLLCDPHDAVLVPSPSYPLFDFLGDIQDVNLFPYELVYDHGWQIDFPSLLTAIGRAHATGSRCRAVLVVHPNNPTGSYVKPHEAAELNRLCQQHHLAIIADEVFLDYSLPHDKPLTFCENRDALTFTLSGLSKISGLPQMKVAWITVSGPEVLAQSALARLEVIADTYLSMNAPVQQAVPTMLEQRRSIRQQLLQRVQRNLRELDAQLTAQTMCSRLVVEGGWYAILRVPALMPDEDLAIALLRSTGVLVQPGHFYDFATDGTLVISLIGPCNEFATGLSRLLRFIESFAE